MRRDDGTVLVLTLGLAGLLLVVVAIVVDVSAVVLAKRGVASAADGAAVSAAQALDEQVLYDQGLGAAVPLSAADAAARVAAYEADARAGQPGLELAVRVEGATAVVTAVRTVRPPFRVFGQGDVTLTAVARARAPVIAP
ncbi:MAG TPA: pilus assembly protein TadG-related protein [Mycobacteriales bacterium]|nr:pilus assembly protein TadG-related protein [Mycobacteriales bacterium]